MKVEKKARKSEKRRKAAKMNAKNKSREEVNEGTRIKFV